MTTDVRPTQPALSRPRRKTRVVRVGSVVVGGDAPISVQSMTTTDTRDAAATVAEIRRLEEAGCEIARVAVPDREAATVLGAIKREIGVPLVADIHFDYRLALIAAEQGVDCLRINPGNIGERSRIEAVVKAAKERRISIRIGVNAGSLEEDILERSLKASHPLLAVQAYRLMAEQCDYPFHLGITEAGPLVPGTVKSSIGLGLLLAEGIGDTIRVSLTADPVEEVKVGFEILKALRLRHRGVNIISCPTCGRLEIDLFRLAAEIERRLAHVTEPLDVAVLGCVVNGIGEGREADFGIAGGKGVGLLFRKGEIVRKVKEAELADALVDLVESSLRHSALTPAG
ncbi:MAG: flavodoxin-dependent (E)-4-hydroxy-3-methylbut-2-enyl-diphosphate synthase [Nitrospirae bacterium]|nr:flavodoxin-dependent (E)-4-hydroxy-3-methylbut-2-enyl-diphosphate synthase [Nitrospirota bacterium]